MQVLVNLHRSLFIWRRISYALAMQEYLVIVSKWIFQQYRSFLSISYYFHIPIIFDYLDIHCPTEVMAVGTIIFPVRVEEQFFFQYWLQFVETFKWKSLSDLSSTKIVCAGNRTRNAWVQGERVNSYTIWACLNERAYLTFILQRFCRFLFWKKSHCRHRRRTSGPMKALVKMTIVSFILHTFIHTEPFGWPAHTMCSGCLSDVRVVRRRGVLQRKC